MTSTRTAARFPTGLALGLYAAMLGLACLWSWVRDDPALLIWEQARRVPLWQAVLAGVASGLAIVGASRLATRRFSWAVALEDEFARLLGPLSAGTICALTASSALAEEAFFRAAMQPSLGLVPTALIFGLLHFGPGRVFLPWTAMALGMGFGLGGLASWSGSLVAPVLCHATINGLNLWAIALKAHPSPAPR